MSRTTDEVSLVLYNNINASKATYEEEPPQQFAVGEEIECASRGTSLEPSGHIDPELHPIRRWSGQWVEEEHEQDTGVDANVEVSHSPDAADVGAVVGTDGFVLRREGLKIPTVSKSAYESRSERPYDIPVRSRVGLSETLFR